MHIAHSLRDYGFERWAGLFTWALLTAISLWLIAERPDTQFLSLGWFAVLGLFVAFIAAFSFATQDEPLPQEPASRFLLLGLQLLCVYGLFWLIPLNFLAILLTMWCVQLPHFFPVRTAAVIALIISVPHALIFQLHWDYSNAWLSTLLFWAFHLFAILMMASQLREVRAREREQATNRELRATQALLTEVNKQNERTRIARNIHDLLGHHLTALAIQLQVAERQSEGDVKKVLQRSQSIAKLLLSDVREAVSEIRSNSDMPLSTILQELVYEVPGKEVVLDVEPSLHLQQVEVADAVVRIAQEGITNFVRHSRGDRFTVRVRAADNTLVVEMSDNGTLGKVVEFGNGLRGMQARTEALNGVFSCNTEQGLAIAIELPMESPCQ